jgi:hypothetical protein
MEAHAAARHSHEGAVAADAMQEENSAKAAAKKGTVGDSASATAGYMLPPAAVTLAPRRHVAPGRQVVHVTGPPGRTPPPLLQPPLA